MTHPIPSNDDLCRITSRANDLANNCHAAYWLETCGEDATHLRSLSLVRLERLAELFGARLVYDRTADMDREMTRNGRDLSAAQAAKLLWAL